MLVEDTKIMYSHVLTVEVSRPEEPVHDWAQNELWKLKINNYKLQCYEILNTKQTTGEDNGQSGAGRRCSDFLSRTILLAYSHLNPAPA